jgi:hypothetical protein
MAVLPPNMRYRQGMSIFLPINGCEPLDPSEEALSSQQSAKTKGEKSSKIAALVVHEPFSRKIKPARGCRNEVVLIHL